MNKKRLGKGLGALLPAEEVSVETPDSQSRVIEISIEDIEPNPYQPRREFDPELLQELSESIKEHGIIQPISIRKIGDKYQLVAGERRLRAAKIAGLAMVPAIEKEYDDRQMMEIALIENIQREDLNPIEEALAYKNLMEQFGLTQEDVSGRVSKSRSAIANTIRLLNLPQEIQNHVSRETLSMGHARALLGLNEPEEMLKVCTKCLEEGLTVRQLEEYIKEAKNVKSVNKEGGERKTGKRDPEMIAAEQRLSSRYLTVVKIESDEKKPKIVFEFTDIEEMQKVIKILEEN